MSARTWAEASPPASEGYLKPCPMPLPAPLFLRAAGWKSPSGEPQPRAGWSTPPSSHLKDGARAAGWLQHIQEHLLPGEPATRRRLADVAAPLFARGGGSTARLSRRWRWSWGASEPPQNSGSQIWTSKVFFSSSSPPPSRPHPSKSHLSPLGAIWLRQQTWDFPPPPPGCLLLQDSC